MYKQVRKIGLQKMISQIAHHKLREKLRITNLVSNSILMHSARARLPLRAIDKDPESECPGITSLFNTTACWSNFRSCWSNFRSNFRRTSAMPTVPSPASPSTPAQSKSHGVQHAAHTHTHTLTHSLTHSLTHTHRIRKRLGLSQMPRFCPLVSDSRDAGPIKARCMWRCAHLTVMCERMSASNETGKCSAARPITQSSRRTVSTGEK